MMTPAARAVLDALPHNVTVVDGDLRLGYANPAFWRSAGIEPETCPPGSPVIELVRILAYRGLYGPGDPEAQVASVMALDRSRPLRRRVRAADGSRATDIVSVPLPGGGYATCGVDVTAQAEAEATTEARLRMLEGVLGRARSGLALFDGEMRLNFWNGAYALLLGLPGQIRAGMTPREILSLQQARGEFDASVTTAIADRMEGERHRAAVGLRERPSGDVLRFHNQPAPDGGLQVEVDDITALQRAEDEARRRATVLDGVLSTLPHGVCVFGSDRRVAMFNAAYVRLMDGDGVAVGEKLDDVVRRRIERGEYDEATAARILARMAPGAGQADVMRRVRRNGTVIENSVARLPDGGLISVFTDVTAVHRAEAAARQRAELLDGVLAALPHGVCVYGPDRRVAMFNEAYTQVMDGAPVSIGDHVEEIANRRVAQGEFSQAYRDVSLSRRAGPDLHRDEAVRRRPNGKVISVRAAALPDGGHISVVTDVTALHQAEDAARERAEMLDAVMEALPVGVVVYGADERARTTNPAYRQIMGEGAVRVGESLRELAVRRISTGEQTPEMSSALLSRHLGPQERAGEPIRRLRPDGTAIVTRAGRLPDGGHIAVITDITALHRAEEELRARAEVLEASFAAMRHGFAVFGPDRRLTVANERTADLTGLPAELLVPGRSFEELVEQQVAGGVLTPEEAAAVLAFDRSRPHRYLRQRDDGRVVEILSDPRPDGGFVVTYSDVTALHRAEEELRHRAAMLEASFAAMRHGISIFGPDRRLLAANRRTCELTGIPPERYTPGRLFDDLVQEQVEVGTITAEQAAAVRANDRSRPQVSRRIQADGRVVEVLSDPTADGGFVITFTDVTALHRAEEELRQRAAMQAAMLGTIRQGIILYGPDRRVLASNAKTAELTGMPPGELAPGRLMDDMIDGQVLRGQISADQAAEMKSLDRRLPHRYGRRRRDGRVLDTVSEPTPDGGYVITYSDVTEERNIRAELERARAQAEAASEAKSRFLATMSHELRTPLNAVIGFSEAIALGGDRAQAGQYAAMINEAGRHLLQLVDDILDVARSQTGALPTADEPVPPGGVIEAALTAASAAASAAGLTLVSELPSGLPALRGDARRLRQVLDKLLSNAIKFTPRGGRVTLSAAGGPDGLVIRVVDTGIGIPAAERERMFEPFTQLDSSLARRFQGSGLGLHLARTLADALGGTLTLEDPDGPGLVAVLRFPSDRLAGTPAGIAAGVPAALLAEPAGVLPA